MKKLFLTSILTVFILGLFIYQRPQNSLVLATETSVVDDQQKEVEIEEELNPTIIAAIEQGDIDFWETGLPEFSDSDTFLVLPEGAFIHGGITLDEPGQSLKSWDSDTDPNAATLGEIKAAVKNAQ